VALAVARVNRPRKAYIIGAFFFVGGVAACFMIPAPFWFIAADLLLAYFPMAWLAVKLTGAAKEQP
jgi:hypothetical protein